ncbi:MAG: hypothetical protein HY901_13170, partial [Deltaproteobacteria bacterium]|nr:hypothetical protein [Deltaproteobacteria bacterium]
MDEPLAAFPMTEAPQVSWHARHALSEVVAELPGFTLRQLLESPANEEPAALRSCFVGGQRTSIERSLRAYLRALSKSPYYSRLDAHRAEPPPEDPTHLRQWALALGIERALTLPLLDTPYSKPSSTVAQVLYRKARNLQLGAAASKPFGVGVPNDLSAPAREQLRAHARACLLARAIIALRAAASERLRQEARSAPPANPLLAPLARALSEQLQAGHRELSLPGGWDLRGKFTLDDDALRLSWRATGSFWVLFQLDGWRHGPVPITCECGSSTLCAHRLRAMDATLDMLYEPTGAMAARLAKALATPAWSKVLRSLDAALGPEHGTPGAAVPGKELQVSWRLAASPDLRLTPFVHARLKTGAWSAGTRAPLNSLPEAELDLPNTRAILALLSAHQRYGHASEYDYDPYDYADDEFLALEDGDSRFFVFQALGLLAGHPRVVHADDPSTTLQVVHGKAELALTRGEEQTWVLGLHVDGDAELGAKLVALGADSRYHALVDPERRALILLELSPTLECVVKVLRQRKAAFPPEALEELFRRISRLGPSNPLHLPPELEGHAVEADRRLVLRLTPTGTSLLVEALVRPLPGGPTAPPGEGPVRISAFAEGRRVFVDRDQVDEVARARQLLCELALPPVPEPGPEQPAWSPWRIDLAGEEGLDLLAALERRAGTDVVVEWPREEQRIKVTRSAEPKSLTVSIERRQDWFGLSGEVEIDGERVALAVLFDAMRRGRRYVELGPGRFMAVSEELRARASKAAEVVHVGRAGLEASLAAAEALDDLLDSAGEARLCDEWRSIVERMRSAKSVEPALPAGLVAELRPYQVGGFRWLSRMAAWGAG